MKNTFKIIALMLLSVILLNCSKEDFETHSHESISNKNEISFKQFKAETGITKFDYIKTANINRSTDLMARDIEAEFVTDTIGIKKYVNPVDSKTTYSFKIYPLSESLNSNQYYNLVYEKIGTEWNEIIFYNIEKTNPTHTGELESSEMVYNRMSVKDGWETVVSVSLHCTHTGKCASGKCDGCARCVTTTISYVWVGVADTGNGPGGSIPGSGSSSGEGGGNDSGIYIPNPYEGDVAIDNLDFLLAGQVASFTNTLAPNLQTLIANTPFIYPYLVDFCRNNGGTLSSINRQKMVQALTNYNNFQLNSLYPNLTSISINRLNLWAFYSFLNNNLLNANTTKINVIKDFIIDAEFDIANEIVDYLYEDRADEEAIDFVKDVIDALVDGVDDDRVCLSSFEFTDVGGNWQNAGISNVNVQFLTIGTTIGLANVNFPELHFGLPKEMLDGTYITNHNARYIGEIIMTQAEAMTNTYQSINPTATAIQLKSYFLSQMVQISSTHGGTVSTSSPLGWTGTLKPHQSYIISSGIECD
jgi:hypothetical protein